MKSQVRYSPCTQSQAYFCTGPVIRVPHLLVNEGSKEHVTTVHIKHPLSFHKTIKYENM